MDAGVTCYIYLELMICYFHWYLLSKLKPTKIMGYKEDIFLDN